MSLAGFLLPNFNLDALTGLFIAVAGLLLIIASNYLKAVPKVQGKIRIAGLFILAGGLVYWFGLSIVQDILADKNVLMVVIGLLALLFIGFMIFYQPRKNRNGRKRK